MQELFAATTEGDLARVHELLAAGADVTAANPMGQTPLHVAAIGGAADIAELLVRHGADVNAVDHWGNAPMYLALTKGHVELARWLRARGGDPLLGGVAHWARKTGTHAELFADLPDPLPPAKRPGRHQVLTAGRIPRAPRPLSWDEERDRLSRLLVPASGLPRTVQGEVVRQVVGLSRVTLERDEIALRETREFLTRTLASGHVFTAQEQQRLQVALDALSFELPAKRLVAAGDEVARLAIRWCLFHHDLIPLPCAAE